MDITNDPEADTAYITIAQEIKDGQNVQPIIVPKNPDVPFAVIIYVDTDDHILGFEIFEASKHLQSEVLTAAEKL